MRSSRASICGLGCALRLQVGLQDVDVIAELFETVALDGLDLLQQFPAVEYRLRGDERFEVLTGLRST
jgi:hypothetical protein